MSQENSTISLSFQTKHGLKTSNYTLLSSDQSHTHGPLFSNSVHFSFTQSCASFCNFASLSMEEKTDNSVTVASSQLPRDDQLVTAKSLAPSSAQLLRHPLALLSLVPKDVAIFLAGAISGVVAKTVTAPLDRIKLLMQTHAVRAGQESTKKAIGFLEVVALIGKEEGIKGYWKGNLPQVIFVLPYSAVQLLAYETYKKLLSGKDGKLSVIGRLAAVHFYVLRVRLAVEPGYQTMSQMASTMLREEGMASFYCGLGPTFIHIAPYIAINFCTFDLVKKSLPEKYRQTAQASLFTAVAAAALATLTCYPLDTIRRQMQMRGTPYKSVLDAFPAIIQRDGVIGLYRGFVPNALKNLPNSSIKLTTFDMVKRLIAASEQEFQRIVEKNSKKQEEKAIGVGSFIGSADANSAAASDVL